MTNRILRKFKVLNPKLTAIGHSHYLPPNTAVSFSLKPLSSITIWEEIKMSVTAMTQSDAYKLMLREYPDIMSVEQVSEVLGISTKTCYKLLRAGTICCLKVGRSYRIPKAHLFTYMSIGGETVEK